MVRKRGYIPQHCHHKHKKLGYVYLNGRTIYTRRWGTPEAEREYERLIAEWLVNGRQLARRLTGKDGYLIEHLVTDFWRWAEGHYRKHGEPTREINNIRDAVRPLLELYGHTDADEFDAQSLKALRKHVVDQGRWARTTVNSRFSIIKRMFRWGVEDGLVAAIVYAEVQSVRAFKVNDTAAREPDRPTPVSEEDMRAVLDHVSPQVRAMILLQWAAGMRPGEVVLMRWEDITRHEDDPWMYRPSRHKNEHRGLDRKVWLGEAV